MDGGKTIAGSPSQLAKSQTAAGQEPVAAKELEGKLSFTVNVTEKRQYPFVPSFIVLVLQDKKL
jgi:hypothetical protein